MIVDYRPVDRRSPRRGYGRREKKTRAVCGGGHENSRRIPMSAILECGRPTPRRARSPTTDPPFNLDSPGPQRKADEFYILLLLLSSSYTQKRIIYYYYYGEHDVRGSLI